MLFGNTHRMILDGLSSDGVCRPTSAAPRLAGQLLQQVFSSPKLLGLGGGRKTEVHQKGVPATEFERSFLSLAQALHVSTVGEVRLAISKDTYAGFSALGIHYDGTDEWQLPWCANVVTDITESVRNRAVVASDLVG